MVGRKINGWCYLQMHNNLFVIWKIFDTSRIYLILWKKKIKRMMR